jgi:hypothetical protein
VCVSLGVDRRSTDLQAPKGASDVRIDINGNVVVFAVGSASGSTGSLVIRGGAPAPTPTATTATSSTVAAPAAALPAIISEVGVSGFESKAALE